MSTWSPRLRRERAGNRLSRHSPARTLNLSATIPPNNSGMGYCCGFLRLPGARPFSCAGYPLGCWAISGCLAGPACRPAAGSAGGGTACGSAARPPTGGSHRRSTIVGCSHGACLYGPGWPGSGGGFCSTNEVSGGGQTRVRCAWPCPAGAYADEGRASGSRGARGASRMVIGASGAVLGRRSRFFRSRRQSTTPPPAATTTPRPPTSRPLPPLEVSVLVVVPAGVAGLSAGAGVLRGVDGVTAPCRKEAAVGVGSPTEAEGDASGEPETAGPEAEGEGAGDEPEGEEEGVGVGDGGPGLCP